MTNLKQTLQASVERGEMTIPQFMEKQRVEGGVDLRGTDDGSSASQILTAEQGRKYRIGKIVASGGMGAILDAKDVNLKRSVAMKVLLDPEQASRSQILRFIQEAQITGQLEHPSIVPLHELGVDAGGNVFYTMKFVQGETLKAILESIREGDKKAIDRYPLGHLLNIFQRICDAIAFAHSKRVMHRDLKPENVMVGEYGEVLVMDWGLAKVLPRKKVVFKGRPQGESKPEPEEAIDSVRKDAGTDDMQTIDGMVMGTPGFMASEQALGETDRLDLRTDIYALGAILYNVLTLHPPVTGKDLDEMLDKVAAGSIPHPSRFNPSPKGRGKALGTVTLSHCPGLRIPDSLSAVAMKALALKQIHRYQNVKALQRDIRAYQSGYATRAESASAWRQITLFVARHSGATAAIVIITMLLTTASWLNFHARIKAEKAQKETALDRDRTRATLEELRGTAPAIAAHAEVLFEKGRLEASERTLSYAIQLVSEHTPYLLRKAHMLQAMLRIEEALQAYEEVLALQPANAMAKENRALCRKVLGTNKNPAELKPGSIHTLWLAMKDQGRAGDALATVRHFAGDEGALKTLWTKILKESGIKPNDLTVDNDGHVYSLDLSGSAIHDLTPISELPLTSLNIADCKNVDDITPLQKMNLYHLVITPNGTVKGMDVIRGMESLKTLSFSAEEPMSPAEFWTKYDAGEFK
jgi:serine/threonine protein kinase